MGWKMDKWGIEVLKWNCFSVNDIITQQDLLEVSSTQEKWDKKFNEKKNANNTCLRGGFRLVSIVLVQSEETTWSTAHIPYFHLAVCT